MKLMWKPVVTQVVAALVIVIVGNILARFLARSVLISAVAWGPAA